MRLVQNVPMGGGLLGVAIRVMGSRAGVVVIDVVERYYGEGGCVGSGSEAKKA